jgi:GNAT superfamily N-acetyltransferase
MFRPLQVISADDRARFCNVPAAPLSPETVARQQPDASWLLAAGDNIMARCSLWWQGTPPHDGHRLGYIGHYAATDAAAAHELLGLACARLAEQGCTLAVGPMDGNTWQRYRFVTERGSEPPFFLEPDNPDDWPRQWADFGFTSLAQYYSAVNPDLGVADPRMTVLAQRVHDHGVVIHTLEADRFEEELRRVHALSLLSFRDNFLYSPISEADFLAQYSGIRRHLRPDMVLLAENGSELVGYLFGIPELLRAQRGELVDTAILKTMAVHPEHGGMGLGSLLMARFHEAARQAGFKRAIHALFHESNRSGRLSSHTAHVFRRYTLLAFPLKASS